MLSAGKTTIAEQRTVPSTEIQRSALDLKTILDTQGIEGVQREAESLAQQEKTEAMHMADLRDEDRELAPEEAKEMEASKMTLQGEVEAAMKTLMEEMEAAMKVSTSVPESAATANAQEALRAPTVAEQVQTHGEAEESEEQAGSVLAEDPGARQQQSAEAADQTERKTAVTEFNPKKTSYDRMTSVESLTAEALAQLRQTGETAFLNEDLVEARKAQKTTVETLNQLKLISKQEGVHRAADEALELAESIPFDVLEGLNEELASAQHLAEEDEALMKSGQIKPEAYQHVQEVRAANIQAVLDRIDEMKGARQEVFGSFQEALKKIDEESQQKDVSVNEGGSQTNPKMETSTRSSTTSLERPSLEKGINKEVMTYLHSAGERAFLEQDIPKMKEMSMVLMATLDQARASAKNEQLVNLIDQATGHVESIPYQALEMLDVGIKHEEALMREDEYLVRAGEIDPRAFPQIQQGRAMNIHAMKSQQESLSRARMVALRSYQDALELIELSLQANTSPPEAPKTEVVEKQEENLQTQETPVAEAVQAEKAVETEVVTPPSATEARATANIQQELAAPTVSEIVQSHEDVSLKSEVGQPAPVVEDPGARQQQSAEAGDQSEKTRVNQETRQAAPDATAQSKQEASTDRPPSLDQGFTPEVVAHLHSLAKDAFTSDDPAVLKSGYRKLMIFTHTDKLETAAPEVRASGERISKIASQLNVLLPHDANKKMRDAQADLDEAQQKYLKAEISADEYGRLRSEHENSISEAERLLVYQKIQRQKLFEEFKKTLEEITGKPTDVPNANPQDRSPATSDVQGGGPDQASAQQPPSADSASPATPDQAAAPQTPDAIPSQPRGPDRMKGRRQERLKAARKSYDEAVAAVNKQQELIEQFKNGKQDEGEAMTPIDNQYVQVMELILKGLKLEEQLAEAKLHKLELEDEIATTEAERVGLTADVVAMQKELDDPASKKTEKEKEVIAKAIAAANEKIEGLSAHIEDLKDRLADVEDEIESLDADLALHRKAQDTAEQEYRAAIAKMPDTLEGESQLDKEDRTKVSDGLDRDVKDDSGHAGEMPKDQAPGFGDKLAELGKEAKKVFWDNWVN